MSKEINKQLIKIFLISVLSLSICIVAVTATPVGPSSITVGSDTRLNLNSEGLNTTAIAGNVTQLDFNATTVTQTWQGYFGNVTGKYVLGNSNNNTFYDWSLAAVRGEIYAVHESGTPTWTSIQCADATNIAAEDTFVGANPAQDPDSVTNTFTNSTSFPTFYVGNATIDATAQNCAAANMYDSSGKTSSFKEVLLHDGSNLVYTALLNNGAQGFDGSNYNFEMLVGENGHNSNTETTTYYFYVELG